MQNGLSSRILDATARCVLDFGTKRTTVSDIATRSGLSRATIYNHFDNRDAIMTALMRRELALVYTSIKATLDNQSTINEVIVEAVALLVENVRNNELFQRVLELEPELALPWLTTRSGFFIKASSRLLTPYLRVAIENGDIRPLDLETIAEWLAVVSTGLAFAPNIGPKFRDGNFRPLIHEFVVRGLAASEAASAKKQ